MVLCAFQIQLNKNDMKCKNCALSIEHLVGVFVSFKSYLANDCKIQEAVLLSLVKLLQPLAHLLAVLLDEDTHRTDSRTFRSFLLFRFVWQVPHSQRFFAWQKLKRLVFALRHWLVITMFFHIFLLTKYTSKV